MYLRGTLSKISLSGKWKRQGEVEIVLKKWVRYIGIYLPQNAAIVDRGWNLVRWSCGVPLFLRRLAIRRLPIYLGCLFQKRGMMTELVFILSRSGFVCWDCNFCMESYAPLE
ncbi:hypothetical protein CDAR_255171 [Caerostris darwini]|uniref:Uncharacterized protein n=1 Tax=Caerostris darwini TaxID=1538125 RepID=A0AAV4V1D8_9ARAC|nr:hypothetical protein CDAR_255171 [Caerostris darwini]